jgi:hypothetical protein
MWVCYSLILSKFRYWGIEFCELSFDGLPTLLHSTKSNDNKSRAFFILSNHTWYLKFYCIDDKLDPSLSDIFFHYDYWIQRDITLQRNASVISIILNLSSENRDLSQRRYRATVKKYILSSHKNVVTSINLLPK